MVKNILFLADGSIDNPILLSQGIPLLKEISRRGNVCLLVTHKNYPDYTEAECLTTEKLENSEVIHIEIKIKYSRFYPNWMSFFITETRQVIRLISLYKINILHCRSLFPSLVGLIIKVLFKPHIKLIYDNRGVFIEEEIEKGHWSKNSFKIFLFRFLEKIIIINSCDQIIVVSKAFKHYLINKFNLIMPNLETKVTVINNKTRLLPPDIALSIESYKSREKIYAIYNGSGAIWQNIDELVQLIQIAEKKFPEIFFKVISYDLESILMQFKSCSINKDRVEFVQVASSDVQKLLIRGNFGVLLRKNSIINKVSSPLKFAEYLAAGLPVLVSRGVGDTEEMIKKFNVGVIHDSDHEISLRKMLKILEDSNIYNKCLEVASLEFDMKDSIDNYNQVYDRI